MALGKAEPEVQLQDNLWELLDGATILVNDADQAMKLANASQEIVETMSDKELCIQLAIGNALVSLAASQVILAKIALEQRNK